MPRSLLLLGLLPLVMSESLVAQRAQPTLAPWEAPSLRQSAPPPAITTDSAVRQQGDYRYEGLVVGGLTAGALGAWLGSRDFASCTLEAGGQCTGNGDKLGNGIAVGLLGAAVGGGLGYLVGRFSPRRPAPDPTRKGQLSPALANLPDSVRRVVGYQHWRGAGMGAAIGGVFGAVVGVVLGDYVSDSCSDCQPWSRGHRALVMGLLGTGTGGVIGFLAGLSRPKYEWVRPTSPEPAPPP